MKSERTRVVRGGLVGTGVALAAWAVTLSGPGLIASAAGQDRAVNAAGAEAEGADLALRRIVLYRSGVGYFERTGTVRGDATAALRFEEGQINDILKSMVLLDLDPGVGGTVSGVMYGSKEPLERRLKAFGVDISGSPSMIELFTQLRGARVRLIVPDGAIDGTILGVETRSSHMQKPFVMLVTESGVRTVDLWSVSSFELADARLREELNKALAALAEHRADRSKTVEVRYTGPADRDRRVAVGYVHEMPVWKTTYRLILPDDAAPGSQGANGSGKLRVQGMAIVENTTGQDWVDVRLSLASGRPVGFVMPLYDPVYAARPVVPVPGLGAVMVKVFEQMAAPASYGRPGSPSAAEMAANRVASQFAVVGRDSVRGSPLAEGGGELQAVPVDMSDQPMLSGADGGEVGEQFMYALASPVTLKRQESAMLPILDSTIGGRRVSIYSAGDGRPSPMRGVELKNDSGLHLMPGPVSVFDGSAYAGDAQVPHTGRNSTQLLAYAIDLDVQSQTKPESSRQVRKIRIVDGALEETVAQVSRTAYSFDNRDASRGRTILVEHPKMPGWELVTPQKADQETDSLYRFELALGKGESGTVDVEQQMIVRQTHAITSYPVETLIAMSQQGRASQAVVDAFRKAGALQGALRDIERRMGDIGSQRTEISNDQSRIRSNMGSVDRNSDLYRRYMAMLAQQESRLEALREDLEVHREQRAAAQAAFDDFVRNLNVE